MSRTKKSPGEAAEHTAASAKEQRAQALENAAAYLSAAQAKAGPLAAQAAEKIGPLGEEAWKRGAKAVSDAGDRIQPALSSAREIAETKVVPAIHQAYDSFQKDVLPDLEDKASQVASHPAVEEATRRSQAALAALKGQTQEHAAAAASTVDDAATKAAKGTRKTRKAAKAAKAAAKDAAKAAKKSPSKDVVKPKKQHKVLKTFLVLSGLAVAGAVAARKFLGSSDDGWTARQPSETYSWTPKAPAETAPKEDTAPAAEPPAEESPTAEESPAPAGDETTDEATMTEEGGPAPEGTETTAESASETSYVGEEPPEGFVIKGNDRSKKYHVPGSGGYDRTIADIWFSSEEAAQAAGFTKASR